MCNSLILLLRELKDKFRSDVSIHYSDLGLVVKQEIYSSYAGLSSEILKEVISVLRSYGIESYRIKEDMNPSPHSRTRYHLTITISQSKNKNMANELMELWDSKPPEDDKPYTPIKMSYLK